MMKYFNSIKVRLELISLMYADFGYLFQFHKGTIRTKSLTVPLVPLLNFNSIKVRLELKVVIYACTLALFQFHKGTIRTERRY